MRLLEDSYTGLANQRIRPLCYPHPDLAIALRWPSGTTTYYAHCQQFWEDWQRGRLPFFPRGINLEHISNDGSADWADLRSRVLEGAVHSSEALF